MNAHARSQAARDEEWLNAVLMAQAAGWDRATLEGTDQGTDFVLLWIGEANWRRTLINQTPAQCVVNMLRDDANNNRAYFHLYSSNGKTRAASLPLKI
jgi:hypothetical protein